MTSALFPTALALAVPKRIVRPFWLATCGWFIASVACGTAAVASVPLGEWSPATTGVEAVAAMEVEVEAPVAAPVSTRLPAGLNGRFAASCNACGVVEIIRVIEALGTLPATYEYTVRFRDGSSRVSSGAGPAGWRVGDSIMLIGGAPVGG